MTETTMLLCGISLLVIVLTLHLGKGMQLKRHFGLPWYSWLVYTDLGGGPDPRPLLRHGLAGKPDAIFFDCASWCWIVIEYKSRRHRGQLMLSEYYQTLLYMGMVRRWWCPRVTGAVYYRDGVEQVHFNGGTYQALLNLLPEFKRVRRNQFRVVDPRPLHQRLRTGIKG